MAYKVVDLFAGVGGLSYGFAHDPDFEILAANEILKPMAEAYSKNHPTVKVYNKDIREFSIEDLNSDFGVKQGDIDVVIGGPPCQAYSTVGKRLIDDPRGKLFQEYYRILVELRPKIFVFENVKGLLSMQDGKLLRTIISLFESIGYHMQKKVLNAADFGTPQIRERVVLVGTLDRRPFAYPHPTHYNPELGIPADKSRKPYVTLKEALGDLPPIVSGERGCKYISEPQNDFQRLMRTNAPVEIQEHEVPKTNERLVALMEALPDGGSPRDVPEELRPKSGFANCYCRLWWNKPSTTITRNLGCVSSSRCVHPRDPRPLSTREGARIQGFPDDYVFCGSRGCKHLQIGNAVPTFLSKAIKDSVKSYLMSEGVDDVVPNGDVEPTLFD
ncbi:MAG: DNA cytosine methyltransferase [Tidjanibacter sp.]|nr:DNA cytosine methyltransferase [Tidjanibacter sp.]